LGGQAIGPRFTVQKACQQHLAAKGAGFLMHGLTGSPEWTLGSVALRYRQPLVPRSWPPPAARGAARRYRWLGVPAPEASAVEGPTARSQRVARLEAVLLLAREPLGSRKLSELASLADGTEARTLVRRLNRMYDLEGCAFRVEEVAGGFQLMSRPQFAPWLRRLHASPMEVRLSGPAMETLAVVAYRQPVLRAEVESIRGVQCGEILRQLMERDLVRIVGRSEELGRPFLYGTTRHFLEVFGLRHLDDLPRPEPTRAVQPDRRDGGPADTTETGPTGEVPSPPLCPSDTQGEENVKSRADTMVVPEEIVQEPLAAVIDERSDRVHSEDANSSDDDQEYEDDYDEEEDEDLEDEEEDEDLEDEEEEEDLEDEEWEEVEDDDEEEDEEEDWDDEDEDWDDEEEEEEEEDWE
jgi:segregation and condensation protein B